VYISKLFGEFWSSKQNQFSSEYSTSINEIAEEPEGSEELKDDEIKSSSNPNLNLNKLSMNGNDISINIKHLFSGISKNYVFELTIPPLDEKCLT
jgi:hypothetical protein